MRKLSSILNSAFVETVNRGGLKNTPVVEAAGRAESPIEAQLMMHVMRYDFVVCEETRLSFVDACGFAEEVEGRVCCFQQVWVDDFRPDFMFIRSIGAQFTALVVEADGMDWHYSNEAQIINDNRRLAAFAKRRIHTMRFLGREIWKECETVISHVRDFFDSGV